MGLLVVAHRRDDLLADVGPAGARRAAGQRDPARGAVRDQAGPDPLAVARARPEQGAQGRRPHVLLPPLPPGTARGARRRLLDRRPLAHRARALAQSRADRLGAQPVVARRPVARQAQRQADHRRHRRHDARRQRPARRARRARQHLRRGRRARSAHGPRARDGVVAQLQPERRRGELRQDREDPRGLHGRPRRSSTGPPRASTRRARRSRS